MFDTLALLLLTGLMARGIVRAWRKAARYQNPFTTTTEESK